MEMSRVLEERHLPINEPGYGGELGALGGRLRGLWQCIACSACAGVRGSRGNDHSDGAGGTGAAEESRLFSRFVCVCGRSL